MKTSVLKKFTQSKIFQLIVIGAIVVIVTTIIQGNAYNKPNLRQIMNTITINLIFVCAVAPLLMCGGIDWAGSAIGTAAMMVFAKLLQMFPGIPWPIMLLPLMISGAIIGALNAFFIVKLNLVAFIATMAMSTVISGITNWTVKGVQLQITDKAFTGLSSTFLFDMIPVFFIFALILVVFYSWMMMKTNLGRNIVMCGGNAAAARLAGINPQKIKTMLFINSGVIASLGGAVWAAQNRMATPTALMTTTPHMTAFIGALLGGVSFFGGSGSLGGAFFGVALIQLLAYSLQTMGIPIWVNGLINGMLLIIALTIDDIARRLRMKKLGLNSEGGGKGAVMPGMSK
ncbi:MAG: ABC transporter permease [Synergistaceae bacterium]|jgi:ribose/xylose/arabinose/galactoside ABC-type transport system permease subunit|nr:ABC transporter permease [Synergistaceae bacterium]